MACHVIEKPLQCAKSEGPRRNTKVKDVQMQTFVLFFFNIHKM
jgi:hypothetical protein